MIGKNSLTQKYYPDDVIERYIIPIEYDKIRAVLPMILRRFPRASAAQDLDSWPL